MWATSPHISVCHSSGSPGSHNSERYAYLSGQRKHKRGSLWVEYCGRNPGAESWRRGFLVLCTNLLRSWAHCWADPQSIAKALRAKPRWRPRPTEGDTELGSDLAGPMGASNNNNNNTIPDDFNKTQSLHNTAFARSRIQSKITWHTRNHTNCQEKGDQWRPDAGIIWQGLQRTCHNHAPCCKGKYTWNEWKDRNYQ